MTDSITRLHNLLDQCSAHEKKLLAENAELEAKVERLEKELECYRDPSTLIVDGTTYRKLPITPAPAQQPMAGSVTIPGTLFDHHAARIHSLQLEIERLSVERCPDCNGELFQCDELDEDGEPGLDCRQCQLWADVTQLNKEREDLAILIRRLARIVTSTGCGETVVDQAMDYLKRKGLSGSVLRVASEEADDD